MVEDISPPKSSTETTTQPIARIYLVRHGETQENREGIIQGQRDTLLNKMGADQARLLGERFKGTKIDWAVSSDLKRAVWTAEAILAHHPGVELEMQRELRERRMEVDLEGTMETSTAFSARAMGWWNRRLIGHVLGKKGTEATMTVLVTTHGGLITTLVRDLLGSRKATCAKGVVVRKCANASVTVIEIGNNRKGTLVAYSDIDHLAGLDVLQNNADVVE